MVEFFFWFTLSYTLVFALKHRHQGTGSSADTTVFWILFLSLCPRGTARPHAQDFLLQVYAETHYNQNRKEDS